MARHGARHAENQPRPGALAAFGGGSDNKEKILSPELAPIDRERAQVCPRQDPCGEDGRPLYERKAFDGGTTTTTARKFGASFSSSLLRSDERAARAIASFIH